MNQECLSCEKLGKCTETSLARVLGGYCCALYQQSPQPVYLARIDAIELYGKAAIEAMLDKAEEPQGTDENDNPTPD